MAFLCGHTGYSHQEMHFQSQLLHWHSLRDALHSFRFPSEKTDSQKTVTQNITSIVAALHSGVYRILFVEKLMPLPLFLAMWFPVSAI